VWVDAAGVDHRESNFVRECVSVAMSSEGNWPPETALFTLRATVAHVSSNTPHVYTQCLYTTSRQYEPAWDRGILVRFPAGKNYSLTQSFQKGCGSPHPPIQRVLGTISSGEQSGQAVKLTTYLHQVPSLRMSGAIHPLPTYDFVACKRITLFLSYCMGLEKLIFTA
jgi:hypothetical protein